MNVRTLNRELQKKAVKELNEDVERIQQNLETVREWLKKQSHPKTRLDDQFLVSFLRGTKWNLQKTKEKIDNYYTVRGCLPEFFADRDPFQPDIQNVLRARIIVPLPNTSDPAGCRIIYLNMSNIHPEKTPLKVVVKVVLMTLDVLFEQDDNINVAGYHLVVNYEKMPPSCFLQITPGLIKKSVMSVMKAYPSRFKRCDAINTPAVLETIINSIVMPFLKPKMRSRLYLYSGKTFAKFRDTLDEALLPEELGGRNGSIAETADQWTTTLESYKDWFLEGAQYGADEQLRPGEPLTFDDKFDMEGTFSKLNID